MRYEEFQSSMGRIVALFPFRDDADQAGYLGVIFEAVSYMDARQFDETVKAVAQSLGSKARRPVPQAAGAARHARKAWAPRRPHRVAGSAARCLWSAATHH